MAHWFVAPPLDGPISGGTLYNRELIAALHDVGFAAGRIDLTEAARALDAGEPGLYWVDSLYLERLPELSRMARAGQAVGMLAHYLPSLVAHGRAVSRAELGADEAAAIDAAGAFLVPSAFMRSAIERLLLTPKPVGVVEPGVGSPRAVGGGDCRGPAANGPVTGVRAILVANLVPGKGIEPLLSALAVELTEADRFRLVVVGSTAADLTYARRCEELLASVRVLEPKVSLAGGASPERVAELMADGNLFVSASRMESFGMALAEARLAGLPIVARVGGNAAFHVHPDWGGELVASERELARACVRLCRNPVEHASRIARARAAAPSSARSWKDAAADFMAWGAPLEGRSGHGR